MTATTETRETGARPAEPAGSGFGAVLRVQLRTGWKAPVIWVLALVGGYAATVAALDTTYGTPEQLATYEQTVGSDPAMAAINGTPYGADTLGGVAANEFGFIAAIAIPLMGLFLVARQTRAPEESGLLELLRSRGVGRRAPWTAAVVVTVVALALVGTGMALVLIAYGEPADAAWLYGASIATLGGVFAGLATFVGQLVRRAAGVTAVGIIVLGGAYLTRAIGDVRDNAWKWLSPLAWQQETRPFADDSRVWPLLLALAVVIVLVVAGLVLVGSRDLGSAMVASRPGPRRASRFGASTLGLALRAHAPAGLGWIAGAAVVGVVFGAFTDDIADAVAANPALAGMFGADAADEGEVALSGKSTTIARPTDAIRHGFGFCPEDRKAEGIFGDLSVRENIIIALQGKLGWFSALNRDEQMEIAGRFGESMDIRAASLDMPIKLLSGGNQQKVILSRWLAPDPAFLILDEPTRGIDVGAHAEIVRTINRLRDEGLALVVISSELDEVVAYSTRIVVMRDREMVAELNGENINPGVIVQAIANHRDEELA